jgi:hypothetical protein
MIRFFEHNFKNKKSKLHIASGSASLTKEKFWARTWA